MIFEIHSENRISYKRLTDADLKRSATSHQTHIGLSNASLTFLPIDKTEYNAMLIYNSYCDIVPCEVGKITRLNGRMDAPNIKTGSRDTEHNVVRKIRDYASQFPDKQFFLLWFGLDSGTPVFWLVCEGSADYIAMNPYCGFNELPNSSNRGGHIITLDSDSLVFASILQYAHTRLERVTIDLQKELELAVELDESDPKFKDSDVKKAQSYIRELGRYGEEMINDYFDKEKSRGSIESYEWANGSSEKGNPYDFWVKYRSGLQQWIDVKTTEHEFEQRVIISKHEIKFITEQKDDEYAIFRVYSKEDTTAKLKICSNCLKYMKKLWRDVNYMTETLSDYKASLVNYKIAFEPGQMSFGSISDELLLRRN